MSIQLKGGFETEDPRLDRLPQFDERSRNFPVTALLGDDLLPLRSRSHYSTLWLDQGREGACVSFAWHHEAGAQPVVVRNLSDAIARDRYYEMQRQDEWPGGAYPGASPRYEGTSVLAGAKVMQEAGFFESYFWAFGIDQALAAISHEGGCVFGIPWLDSMFNTRPDGTLDCSGREVGGHAIYGRGVILPRSGTVTASFPSGRTVRVKSDVPLIRLRNSWGRDWGIDGECLVRSDDMERLLRSWGECCVPTNRKIPS